jgi:hypothetical protein
MNGPVWPAGPTAPESRSSSARHRRRDRRDRPPPPARAVRRHPARDPRPRRPLLRVLIGAAATDPELAELWTQIEKERLSGMGRFARLLADRGVLRPGLSAEEARDLLWTLNSLAVHDLLVRQRGWSPERYRDWLAAALARELLPG